MEEFDREALKEYNGENGKPVYIVYQNRVIDVSGSKVWKGGLHMRRHHAGADLTTDIQAAPHGLDVLDRYPQVGIVKNWEPDPNVPEPDTLTALLDKVPFLRRHPHPMTVHFPIVFMISAPLFMLLFLMTGNAALEATGWHCLGGAVLFTPVAIGTGLFTWWLNYLAKPMPPVTIKLYLAPLAWLLALTAFLWRLAVPDIMLTGGFGRLVFVAVTLALFPLVSVIGWLGAQMTFPLEKK